MANLIKFFSYAIGVCGIIAFIALLNQYHQIGECYYNAQCNAIKSQYGWSTVAAGIGGLFYAVMVYAFAHMISVVEDIKDKVNS
jgi:hypothetical protein